MSSRRLILVDGTYALYRAFFAIRNLATSAGQPTNAVFGFVRMLGQLREQWRPTHWVVVFDGAPRRRLAAWPEYKAQRPPAPDALKAQFAPVEEYLRCARVPCRRLADEEADDVIATLAVRAAAEGAEALMATNDKDLFQLVGERIALLQPAEGGPVRNGAAEVERKTGVPPERIVDWLSLTGDTVDNIPGVRGVGHKTAATLLARFGNLEALWARLEEVPQEKLRTALRGARERVELNRELVRLDTNVDCPLNWDELGVTAADTGALLAFYERMEFRRLARDLSAPQLFGLETGGASEQDLTAGRGKS